METFDPGQAARVLIIIEGVDLGDGICRTKRKIPGKSKVRKAIGNGVGSASDETGLSPPVGVTAQRPDLMVGSPGEIGTRLHKHGRADGTNVLQVRDQGQRVVGEPEVGYRRVVRVDRIIDSRRGPESARRHAVIGTEVVVNLDPVVI